MIQDLRKEFAKEQVENFFEQMRHLGYEKNETVELLNRILKEESLDATADCSVQ